MNGERVPEQVLTEERERLSRMPGWETIETAEERQALLSQATEIAAIDRVLLKQEIDKDPSPLDPKAVEKEISLLRTSNGCRTEMTENLRRTMETKLRLQRALLKIAGPPPHPSPEDTRAFFEANRDKFSQPEKVHAFHIVKNVDAKRTDARALAEIQEAVAELERGDDFHVVAERHSDCKGSGGDVGLFARGAMVSEFDDVVFSLPIDKRSPIFRTPFGYHVALVTEKQPARPATFEDCSAEVESTLVRLMGHAALQRAVAGMRERAAIERVAEAAAAQ